MPERGAEDGAPDPLALALYLAVRAPLLADLDADTPVLLASGDVTVVYVEGWLGSVHDVQVWTNPLRPADHQAVGLAGAMDALHDPHGEKWTSAWSCFETDGTTGWLLGIAVEGVALVAAGAGVAR